MTAPEWADMIAFHAQCDIPDAFMVVGELGSLIAQALGNKHKKSDFAPYYRPDGAASRQSNLGPAFDFLRSLGKPGEQIGGIKRNRP